MKYIENNEKFGIEYDLNKIIKEYKKLKIPSEFDFIEFDRIEKNKYIIDMSERSIGKTNCYLLLGMVFNKEYGTQICYLRNDGDSIKASVISDMFKVIIEYNNGQYIKQLTNGKYNYIEYHWQKFYYARMEEERIVERSEIPFMYLMDVNEHEKYKSSFSNPVADFIIFDEFITKYYRHDTCYMFMDLLKTIIRDRKSPIIVMLANNTNINSMWFEELTIARQIRHIKKGERVDVVTEGGTHFSVKMLENKKPKERKKHNALFFGLNNPKLNAITGEGWSVEEVQHIYRGMDYEKIGQPVFMRVAPNEHLLLQFAIYKGRKILLVKRQTRLNEDAVVLTNGNIEEYKNGYFGLATDKFKKLLFKMLNTNSVYYSTNEVGADFKAYVRYATTYKVI